MWVALIAVGTLVGLAGCQDKKEEAKPATPGTTTSPANAPGTTTTAAQPAAPAGDTIAPEVKKEAEEIFATRCTPCHGPSGKGDGPASAGLTPPPRNFGDPTWQASVTDEHIEKIISYGGAAVGKSPAMPPNPDLVDKPVIKGLRAHVRSLKQQ